MLNPQLAQHLALLQDYDDDNDDDNDDDKADELVPLHVLPETAETDRAPVSASHTATLNEDKGPSETLQRRFLSGLFLKKRPGYSYHLSAYSVVVGAAVVLSVVLSASPPIWRGVVMGLAVILMHYHAPTSLWNEQDNSNSNSNPNNRLLQEALQRQQDSRVRLSTLLGLMGAPPLSGEAQAEETTTTTLLLPCHDWQWTFLQDFAQAHADLVETVDQTMNMLKRATSMGLGLGYGYGYGYVGRAGAGAPVASVERVELAAMSRVRRQSSGATTTTDNVHNTGTSRTGFSLSQSRLRHTLYQLIVRQKTLLLAILDDLNEGIVDDSNDEVYSCRENPPDPVVTLALLRRGRNDLVQILGLVLDRCSSSSKENLVVSDTIQSKQKLSMSLANEARAHLLASLSLSSHTITGRERTPFQLHVSHLHAQIDALQVALIGCHDESVVSQKDGGDEVTEETQAAKWWEHVSHILDEVDATRRIVEQEFFPSSLEPASLEANLEDDFDEQGRARSTEERQEFKADGQPTHHSTEQSHDAQGQRTFIFSGSGAVAPRRKRVEKSTLASHEKPRPAQYDSFMEQSLIHELRSHLQAMPPTDEVNVVEIEVADQIEVAECCDDYEGAQQVVETQAARLRGVSGVASGLFVNELKASLKALSEGERSLQWEVPS